MSMVLRTSFISGGIMLWMASNVLPFCQEPSPRRVCAEYFRSDVVFVGKVISEKVLPEEQGFDGGWLYYLKVSKVYRGSIGKTIEIMTENNSGRYPLEKGRKYLLFACAGARGFEIIGCGNSGLLEESKDRIREIEGLASAIDSSIEINVQDGSEARLAIIGPEGRSESITDKEGRLWVSVPPGRYRVEMLDPEFMPSDISYDQPDDLYLIKGQCAQIQYIKKR
jgi:hypothetical protein